MANFSLEFFRLPERTDAVKTDLTPCRRPGKTVLEKKQNGMGASSMSLQGARVSQNSGQQETTHAKGKHQQEGT